MNFSITMSKVWHRPAIADSVFTYFLKLGEDCCQKKELPEGIYNYGTNGTGIQIIIQLNFGLFEIVHNLNV